MPEEENKHTNQLEAGTYEIIRNRLKQQSKTLSQKLTSLNNKRKEIFGTLEFALISNDKITTENNCTSRDMIPVGNKFLFGYNVHVGLRSGININDVFSVFTYADDSFHNEGIQLITNQEFIKDFNSLYQYYKNTTFSKFHKIGPHVFMVFQVGKSVNDIKSFKWLIKGNELEYLGNRFDHEVEFPEQHEFKWVRAHRDLHRDGKHPHISILDKVFVETVHGDLTIKVEDNTDTGQGIYAEEVAEKDQTLDDAEYLYADLGNIILLKIRPYQEDYRYFAYNHKVQQVKRIDSLEDACVKLPDEQGIIFPDGYYLQTGEFKQFDLDTNELKFERKVVSPNGEDFLYIFYNQLLGEYLLLSYNIISQSIENPILCHGYSLFENGELCYFKSENEAQKHHVIQIWQTPYTGINFEVEITGDSKLIQIGNRDIVKGMSECNELIALAAKDDTYGNLYSDLLKKSGDIIDSYYWLAESQAENLKETILEIKNTASSAIDEFEKVTRVRNHTKKEFERTTEIAKEFIKKLKNPRFDEINDFVQALTDLRKISGEVISLKELRYVDLKSVEAYEKQLTEVTQLQSNACIKFLLKKKALVPYQKKSDEVKSTIEKVEKVTDANKIEEGIDKTCGELEMLIDIVSNLKIEDATETTRIIDNISAIFSGFNQHRSNLKAKRKQLFSKEGKAEFAAQLKLINQSVVNYLDICDSAQKCEEYLNKLMVKVEELEGKFSEFDEFIEKLAEKREELYNAFESRKVALIEKRNKQTTSLQSSADRILKGIKNRLSKFESIDEINGYLASDIMVEKVRDIVNQLNDLDDNVKADDIQSKLKSCKEDAVRQLKDKKDLFLNGENVIKLGNHHFSVNVQNLDLTIVPKDGSMYYHLTGTNFFEEISDTSFQSTKDVWDQAVISENEFVYRAEYLAYKMYQSFAQNKGEYTLESAHQLTEDELLEVVQKYMSTLYNEGYIKGVHDKDAEKILNQLLTIGNVVGLLKYSPKTRAAATLFWNNYLKAEERDLLDHRIKGLGIIHKVFSGINAFEELKHDIADRFKHFQEENHLFSGINRVSAAQYLIDEFTNDNEFIISSQASSICNDFADELKRKKFLKQFDESVIKLDTNPYEKFELIKNWIIAFLTERDEQDKFKYVEEVAVHITDRTYNKNLIVDGTTIAQLHDFNGEHKRIENGEYTLDFHDYFDRLEAFENIVVPKFKQFSNMKKDLLEDFREEIRLGEFKPRVLSSFVRNKLIDELYLPLIGNNLAKQIGVVGENKRTDLMGMLLLISPPGYGKTTLMEYVASRLGLIFMKINGPAIGHAITSTDPMEATNSAAREELEKLNLAFEMGDNVMIYLDDIQHCNPEFLQKFISLCDGQRKIEGVYKGKPKTYDFRGKKVCVVMAGNPYTESGEKFQIPDMLANRADTYNLGDIIGDTEDIFKLSYVENCMTANPTLNKLSGKPRKDIHEVIKIAETGNREGVEFESNISVDELNEFVNVLEKLLVIRDTILKVNLAYIESASQSDEYRTEPPFKLQGSYRNMAKIAEKIVPVMNDKEVVSLLLSHYESESQTLTTGAEANLLKFKELFGVSTEEEKGRWENIKSTFVKNNKLKGIGNNEHMNHVILQMTDFNDNLMAIRQIFQQGLQGPEKEN